GKSRSAQTSRARSRRRPGGKTDSGKPEDRIGPSVVDVDSPLMVHLDLLGRGEAPLPALALEGGENGLAGGIQDHDPSGAPVAEVEIAQVVHREGHGVGDGGGR